MLVVSSRRLYLFDRTLRLLAWRSFEHSRHDAAVVDLAGRHRGIAVRDGPLVDIVAPRKRSLMEVIAGRIAIRKVEISAAAVAAALAGLVGMRRRRDRQFVPAHELASCALDVAHRGKTLERIHGLYRDWGAIECASDPASVRTAADRLARRADYWRDLGRPRLIRFASLLAAMETHSTIPSRLAHRTRIVQTDLEAAAGAKFGHEVLTDMAPTARRSLRELIETVAAAQSLVEQHVTADPLHEWGLVLEAEREQLTACSVHVVQPRADGAGRAVIAPLDLRRIFENLIDNACRSMVGVQERHLDMRCRLNRDRDVEIEVIDSGPGIPQEHREALLAARGRGTGFRLIQSTLSNYHGRLELHAGTGGQGTAVRVILRSSGLLMTDNGRGAVSGG